MINTNLEISFLKEKYSSKSQIARVITENWIKANSYCPSCGNEVLNQFNNNMPVADFFCIVCSAEYELKSQKKSFSSKVLDGAYSKMTQRIHSENNPSFFFMNYSMSILQVVDLIVIPKYYFTDDVIEMRKPLSEKARRAGWIGCNILLQSIPSNGKIYLVRNSIVEDKEVVLKTWAQTAFLSNQNKEKRGWTIEIMNIVDKIRGENFALKDIYLFEDMLKRKFPNNSFIKDKIRQQLQILRDKSVVEFLGNGKYRKINPNQL